MTVIARRIANAHNGLKRAQVLAFTAKAISMEPMTEEESLSLPLGYLPFPIHDAEVTEELVDEWLKGERQRQAEAEDAELERREEARLRNSIRIAERHARAGGGAVQCPGCKRFKSRPSDRCDHCGMTEGSWNAKKIDVDQAGGVG